MTMAASWLGAWMILATSVTTAKQKPKPTTELHNHAAYRYFKSIATADLKNLDSNPLFELGTHTEVSQILRRFQESNEKDAAIVRAVGKTLIQLGTEVGQVSDGEAGRIKRKAQENLIAALASLGAYRPDLVASALINGQVRESQPARVKSYNQEFMRMTPEQQAFFGTPAFDAVTYYAFEFKRAWARAQVQARRQRRVVAPNDEIASAVDTIRGLVEEYRLGGGDKQVFKRRALVAFEKGLKRQEVSSPYRFAVELWNGDSTRLHELSTHQQSLLAPLVRALRALRDLISTRG